MTNCYSNQKYQNLKNRGEFLQLYVQGIEFFFKLKDNETRALLFIFEHLTYLNAIPLNAELRKNMKIALKISKNTVSKSISALKDKGILRPINTPELQERYRSYTSNMFYVDPNIVGKGSFRDLKKITQIIIEKYDSKKMQFTSSIKHTFA